MSTAALLSIGYLLLFVYQLGALVPAEYWARESLIGKLGMLEQLQGRQKVVFVAGSSAHYGIDTRLVEAAVNRPAANLGFDALMPLGPLMDEVQPFLHQGDTLVLPLEFEYYVATTTYNAWFTSDVMAWAPEYFWKLPLIEKARFVLAVPPRRLLLGTLTQALSPWLQQVEKRRLKTREEILKRLQDAWDTPDYAPKYMYSPLNIDRRGNAILSNGEYKNPNYSLLSGTVENTPTWETLEALAAFCHERDIKLLVTWPPIENGVIDFNAPEHLAQVKAIMAHLRRLGIPVLGAPAEFQYPQPLFSDTHYHLTAAGREEHTRHLLRYLLPMIPPPLPGDLRPLRNSLAEA